MDAQRAFTVGMIRRLRGHRRIAYMPRRLANPPKHIDVGALQPRASVLYMQRFLLAMVSPQILHMHRKAVQEMESYSSYRIDEKQRTAFSPAVSVAVHTMKRFALGQQSKLLGIMARDEDISLKLMKKASKKIEIVIERSVRRFGKDLESIIKQVKAGGIDAAKGVEQARRLVSRRHEFLEATGDAIAVEFHAQAAKDIQEDLGVEEYIWSATHDKRTRPMHAALDGTRHRWNDPPVVNESGNRMHPGYDTNFFPCRCIAIPVAPRIKGNRSDALIDKNMRIVIAGGPRTGKTTAAIKLAEKLSIPLRHTDDLISRMPWREASAEVAKWFDNPGPWIIEGVTVVRAIRKWLANNKGLNFPAYVIRFVNSKVSQTTGQKVMHKGEETVWKTVEGHLSGMGLIVDSTRLDRWLDGEREALSFLSL
jgi:SPP1 gp7 family putative phage head morphogenesis protein